ncbi:MAG: CrcB family protein [Rhodobacteraceae bacterium]|nr:MAG: CrcB family protein [Paracoccaceae bacterium]
MSPGLLCVGLGGALGTGLRFAFSLLALRVMADYAFVATLAANVLGAALIGYLATRDLGATARAFWMTGFCGGFTTFSLFSLEVVLLIDSEAALALAYAGGSLLLWLLALWGGVALGRRSAPSGSPPTRP